MPLTVFLLVSFARFRSVGNLIMLRISTDRRIMLCMETWSTFNRKNFIPGFVADVLNTPNEDPITASYLTEIDTEYGPAGRRLAHQEFVGCLRALVDQWIDSSKDPDGIEEPLKRSLTGKFPGSEDPLYEVLVAWVGKNVRPSIERTGKLVALEPLLFFPGLDPISFGRQHAIYWFVTLLDCPGARRLSRCANRGCRQYYARRRLRTAPVKRGAFCSKCGGAGSEARTKVSRDVRKQQLIALAADVWPVLWKPTRRHAKLSELVVAKMKRKTRKTPVTITGKWVSQNRKIIEMEVERRKNAKS